MRTHKFSRVVSGFLGVFIALLFLKFLSAAELHPIFLMAVPLSCVLLLGVTTQPKWTIVLLLFLRVLMDPLLNTTKYDSSLGFGAILNFLVILATLFLAVKNHASPLLKSGFVKAWIIFLCLCLAAIFYTPVLLNGLKVFFNLLSYLCMAMLPSLIDPQKNDKKFWIRVLLFSSVLPVLFGHFDMARGGVVVDSGGPRILSTFTHPNIFAFYLLWLFAVVMVIFKSGAWRLSATQKFFLWIYLLNIVILLGATKTRNAWVCVWLLCFFYGVLKERKYIVYALGALFAIFFLREAIPRIADLFESNGVQENSLAWRVQVWKDSLKTILDRPVFGHGLGSFHELSGKFLTENAVKGADAHNVYVQLLFEMGAVGLAAYLFIYRWLWREFYWRYQRSVSGLSKEYALVMAYLAVYLVSGFGDNILAYLTLNWYCWFFFGVVLKAMRFQRLAET